MLERSSVLEQSSASRKGISTAWTLAPTSLVLMAAFNFSMPPHNQKFYIEKIRVRNKIGELMLRMVLFAKTPVTTSSMWELLYDKIRPLLSDVMVLVERHPKIKNPLERARVEREILEKFSLLEDFADKFKKAFLDKAGKGSADTASLILSMDLGKLSSKDRNPVETLKRYERIVQQKLAEYKDTTNKTIDMFRTEEFEGIQRAYGLRGYANEVKKRVRSNIDSAAKTVGQRVSAIKKQVESKRKDAASRQNAPSHEREGALPDDYKRKIEEWQRRQTAGAGKK